VPVFAIGYCATTLLSQLGLPLDVTLFQWGTDLTSSVSADTVMPMGTDLTGAETVGNWT